jgi:hypothetical protein
MVLTVLRRSALGMSGLGERLIAFGRRIDDFTDTLRVWMCR